MALAEERCEVCRPGMKPISAAEAAELAGEIDDAWSVCDGNARLTRTVKTTDFASASALAVHVGFVAESEGHHPDLHVHWGRLVIDLTTHAADGLTRNDFVLAAKIDALLGDALRA